MNIKELITAFLLCIASFSSNAYPEDGWYVLGDKHMKIKIGFKEYALVLKNKSNNDKPMFIFSSEDYEPCNDEHGHGSNYVTIHGNMQAWGGVHCEQDNQISSSVFLYSPEETSDRIIKSLYAGIPVLLEYKGKEYVIQAKGFKKVFNFIKNKKDNE